MDKTRVNSSSFFVFLFAFAHTHPVFLLFSLRLLMASISFSLVAAGTTQAHACLATLTFSPTTPMANSTRCFMALSSRSSLLRESTPLNSRLWWLLLRSPLHAAQIALLMMALPTMRIVDGAPLLPVAVAYPVCMRPLQTLRLRRPCTEPCKQQQASRHMPK